MEEKKNLQQVSTHTCTHTKKQGEIPVTYAE